MLIKPLGAVNDSRYYWPALDSLAMDGGSSAHIDPLLLPFLQTTDEAEAQLQLDRLIGLAAPMIKKVICWSEYPDDAFQETAQHLVEQLWAIKANPGSKAIYNYLHYVKVVASHVAKGQLREQHRQRRSLVDSLRHVLKSNRHFDLWEDENQEKLCGLVEWRAHSIRFTRSARLLQLLDHPETLGEVVLPACDIQSLDHAELLAEIFQWVGHPIRYDDLVRVYCDLKHIQYLTPIIEDEKEGRTLSELLPDAGLSPDDVLEWNEFLRQLWAEIRQLPRLQRMAYLLNFTAGDGQLVLFCIYGVASIRGIGATLQLTEDQFAMLWPELRLSDEERIRTEAVTSYDEKFGLLWQHLPLADTTIAKIIGTERQKVINLRKAAGDRLSRRLAHGGHG
jgi:hypothetical protein